YRYHSDLHSFPTRRSSDLDHKFKIYISALTQLNIDDHNRIPTTDNRIIRRIVRDHQFRGHNAVTTISLWPRVRRGEEQHIFPFRSEEHTSELQSRENLVCR